MSEPPAGKTFKAFTDGAAIDKALKEAVAEAVLHHLQRGFPVAEWRDGQVVWVHPEDVPELMGRAKAEQ